MRVISGGNVNNGGNAGPFYRNGNNAASNSNWNILARPLCYLSHTGIFPIFEYKNAVPLSAASAAPAHPPGRTAW
nr:hypothetical protein [uncultured Dysosmobacter sp.]